MYSKLICQAMCEQTQPSLYSRHSFFGKKDAIDYLPTVHYTQIHLDLEMTIKSNYVSVLYPLGRLIPLSLLFVFFLLFFLFSLFFLFLFLNNRHKKETIIYKKILLEAHISTTSILSSSFDLF